MSRNEIFSPHNEGADLPGTHAAGDLVGDQQARRHPPGEHRPHHVHHVRRQPPRHGRPSLAAPPSLSLPCSAGAATAAAAAVAKEAGRQAIPQTPSLQL